jgi:glutathione synthase/RimK-type ligase-like ATP-grasp enzyme
MLYKKTILLTGGRAAASLHLARLLKSWYCKVIVAETFEDNLTAASKYVDRSFIIPSPLKSPDHFEKTLKKILVTQKVDWLIPTCEETFHIALHAKALEGYAKLFCPNINTLDLLHNKYSFNQLLGELNLPQLPSSPIYKTEEIGKSLQQLPAFVLKPIYSRFADQVILNDAAYRIPSKLWEELNISEERPWMAQQFVEGTQLASFSILHEGKLSAHAVYPLYGRVKDGAATYFESTPNPEIEQFVRKIAAHLEIKNGFLSFDFIHSKIDGKYYAIECNPRLTSGIHLFQPMERIFDYSLGTTHPKANSQQMLALAYFLFHLPNEISLDNWSDLLRQLFSAKDVVFSWRDIQPFFKQFGSLLHFWQIARKKGISLMAATTEDIEWNGFGSNQNKTSQPNKD